MDGHALSTDRNDQQRLCKPKAQWSNGECLSASHKQVSSPAPPTKQKKEETMKFNITEQFREVMQEPVVGNVYNVRGGSGARKGHMQIIISLTETGCVLVTIDKEGQVVGANCYGKHYFAEKTPMAFCDGIEELLFNVRSI